jgi:hypothetical protein
LVWFFLFTYMFLKSSLFNGATNNPGLNLDDAPETFQKLDAP